MGAVDKRGRNTKEHGFYLKRSFLSTSAWRALSPKAQAVYLWLRLEWKGPRFSNNGKIRLSYRQAAKRVGIGINAAMRAFHELQAKGFIVVTEMGALGVAGVARGPSYELTELPLAGADVRTAKHLYRDWQPGRDFEIARHRG